MYSVVVTFGPLPLPPELEVFTSSEKSVAQMILPPSRIRPNRRGITAPSVAEVMRRLSSRAPSMRWPGDSEATSAESITDPMDEPIMPPMAAPERPRMVPPNPAPRAEPTAPRTIDAMDQVRSDEGFAVGNRKAKAMRRTQAVVSASSITPSRS